MRKFSFILYIVFIAITACSQTEKKGNDEHTGLPVHLTSEEFRKKVFDFENNKEWKYEGKIPAIVDFYADWCRPCKMMAPIMDSLQKKYEGKLIIYKVNVDNEKDLAGAFRIDGIPAFLLIPMTGQPQMTSGYREQADFIKLIEDVLQVK